jgi:hypothetical protein
MTQEKGKRPLPLHPIPSTLMKKCQGCARSKMSGILPSVQPTSTSSHEIADIGKAKPA